MKWFDFAWLKQWWPAQPRRGPHIGRPKVCHKWKLMVWDGAEVGWAETLHVASTATKSEARSRFKRLFNLPRGERRLPKKYSVILVQDRGSN